MDVFSCHVVTLPHEDEETNSRVREATSAWRQSSDAAVVHDRETRRVRSRRCAIHSRIHRWCRTMGGVFLCPTPAKARRAVPEDASTFPRVLPPRPSRVRERFHGDIMVSLSFCAFARDAWTITEMGAGDDPAPGRRENHPLARGNRESSGNRARHGRRAANARTAPTALRRPRAFADQHPFVVTRQSIRIIPSRSRSRVDQRAARSFEFLLTAIAARRARARRLSPLFAGFPFVPFVRSVRIAVGGLPRFSCRPPPLPPPPPPSLASFSSPGRARCRDIAIFILSFGWTRCSVLRVMTRECTREQTTTSYDLVLHGVYPGVHSLAVVTTSRVSSATTYGRRARPRTR